MAVADLLKCTVASGCTTTTSCCANYAGTAALATAGTAIGTAVDLICWPTATAVGGTAAISASGTEQSGLTPANTAYAITACPVKTTGAQALAASAAVAVAALYIM